VEEYIGKTEPKGKNKCRETRNEKANANKEYQSKSKEVKKMIRNDKRKYIEQLTDKAQEAANLGNIKELYENTKLLSQRNWVRNKPIKDKQGVLITNEEKQSQRWKEHFQEVLNNHGGRTTPDSNQETNPNPIKAISIKPPSKTEIITAIRELKKGKAPGIDNVVPEVLKIDPNYIATFF
jgi:hypothetical protein